MGCSSSKVEPDRAALRSPESTLPPTPQSADVTASRRAAADLPTLADRGAASTGVDRVADAKERAEYVGGAASGAIDVAQAILAAAPPGIADSLASAAAEYTAANAPGLAAFIGQLCGTAADLLGAIAPAIPFGGVAAAAFGKALEQGEAYALALQAARDLRKAIADRRPTIEEFAGQASLAAKHASLVGRAAQALRDAVALLAKSYAEGGRSSLRAEVWKFFTAKGGLTALQDAASGINVRWVIGVRTRGDDRMSTSLCCDPLTCRALPTPLGRLRPSTPPCASSRSLQSKTSN